MYWQICRAVLLSLRVFFADACVLANHPAFLLTTFGLVKAMKILSISRCQNKRITPRRESIPEVVELLDLRDNQNVYYMNWYAYILHQHVTYISPA